MKRFFYSSLLWVISVLMVSCAHTPQMQAAAQLTQLHDANASVLQSESLLQSPSASAQSSLLQKRIISAQKELAHSRPKNSIKILNQVLAKNTLDLYTQAQVLEMLADAYFSDQQVLTALDKSAIAYDLNSNTPSGQDYLLETWQHLQQINPNTLAGLIHTTSSEYARGWLTLASIINQKAPINTLIADLNQWKTQFAHHPASHLLSELGNTQAAFTTRPQKIALLLPLSGPLAAQGQAIRNGFLAAFYEEKSTGYTPQLIVLDTNQDNIINIYQKALRQSVNMVIGPLLKANIETLINGQKLTVPTLALNTVPHANTQNLYQFGLSPEDEASQAAVALWKNQSRRIIIIAPDNDWGRRIDGAFEQVWQKLAGQVVAKINYTSHANLAAQIRKTFDLEQSAQRAAQLHHLFKENIRYEPRRRKDFDAIFVVATPEMGRQILPLLRFYYAANIPVFSISQIYAGYADPTMDHDLNGLVFDDMPWLFSNANYLPNRLKNIRESALTTWPNSYRHYARLYALGTDAYYLSANLSRMSMLPQLGAVGASGILYLQANGKIYRKLVWARMEKGHASLLTNF